VGGEGKFSEMAQTAELSCHFHQSIIIKSGQLFSLIASRVRLSKISAIDLKSLISHSAIVLSLYFLYFDVSDFPFTITLLEATVKFPEI
ncbi:TPA: hypothetical protein DEG21_00135, partial [Patescibacteria group bacterium]|nr:hypothetical protein [Candidatus Gracilibacteria bacterium]